nr:CACTA-like transposase family [Arabidopsis thaliana]
MTDQVSRWKGNWKEKGDEAKPKWIDPDVWKGLVLFWQDPKSEKRVTTAEMLGIMIRMAKASINTVQARPHTKLVQENGVRRLEKKLLISLSC